MYELPTELCGHKIRSDYRVILDIITMLDDQELSELDKQIFTVKILYEDSDNLEDFHEAVSQAYWFISLGDISDKVQPRIMDWQQDFSLIVTSINRVLGTEVRAINYLHWWTFVGAYYEIGESLFSNVINIRSKKSKGKKLESYEQEFYQEHRDIIDLKTRYTKEEQDELDRLSLLV